MSFTSNSFALLAEDGDSAPAPVAKAPAAAPAAQQQSIPGLKPRQTNGQGNRAPRSRPQQGDREVNGDVPVAGEAKEDRAQRTAGGRGGRGRGAGRGGRGGANPRSNSGTYAGGDRPRREKGGPRTFDRKSATGHSDSQKAEEQGWGADEGAKELAAEVEGEQDAKKEAADGTATPKAEEAPVVPQEEEDNTQTYEEYLAAQAEKKLNLSLPEARVANDGDDEFKGTKIVKKSDQEVEDFLASAKKEKAAKERKAGKQFLDVDFTIAKPARGGREGAPRGGRGGRGRGEGRGRGGRGGAGRGGQQRSQNNNSSSPAVNLSDNSAFPSLA
ncbi:hypothetical protein OIO90_000821 [Microbotryomycetes sp. JL221]|nr:hypothetical protein OIO90_000821 [Microbotryomycetes sp. JL221]